MKVIPEKVYIRDIRAWEENNQRNILELYQNPSVSNAVELITIFNKDVSEEDIYTYLDSYFEQGNTLLDLFFTIRDTMLGYTVSSDENIETGADDEEDDDEYFEEVDISQFKYLSDFYMTLVMQLMSLGVSYAEAWAMSTKELYTVYEAIQRKKINEFNERMQEAYLLACMNAGAVWGKLPDRPPQISLNQNRTVQTEHGEMDIEAYKSMIALQRLGGTYNG